MPLFGTALPRTEDHRFLTGGAQYISNLDLPGAVCAAYVTSPMAHARIVSIDLDDARRVPGVLGVFSAADLDLDVLAPPDPALQPAMGRPLLATDVVRFVGEAVVAVVADTPQAAADAVAAVVVDYEPLPAVIGIENAQGGPLLFPEAGTNVALHAAGGSDDADVDACEVVVRHTFRSPRLAPAPLETRAAASRWEPDGRLTHWASCQGAHPIRASLAKVYGMANDQIRVIAPDVGGSFGAKSRSGPEELLVPWLARRIGRPVRWLPTRSDDMVGLGHGRSQLQHVTLGGTRDGTLQALHVYLQVDVGAYAGPGGLLPRNTGGLTPSVYRFERVRWELDSVVTNTTPTTAYRGAGRPEAAALVERAVDMYAAEIGMDPVEVRRRNLLRPEDFPYTTPTGITYDSGDYHAAVDKAVEMVGYEAQRAEQAARRARGDRRQLGIGVACFIDRTAGVPGSEYGAVELQPDGSLVVFTGSSPYGQGHHTAWAMLVSDRTGVPMERIRVVHGDTDIIPRGGITGGSRSVQRAGSAVAMAAEQLVDEARSLAADLLEAAVADIVIDLAEGGRFHVAGTPARAVGWAEVAASRAAEDGALKCETDFEGTASFPSGTYVAVVEVDTETGSVDLRRLVTVDDAGNILNPMLALGQVHGGAAQGIAQALFEEFAYDEDGNPLSSNFADYTMVGAPELPTFECALIETPSPNNPLGAKGIAESGTVGAPPAVQNAVVDALSHLGVTHIDMPCTPLRVWEALREARSA